MSTIKSTYDSDIFLGFKAIPKKNFSRKIFYVEKHSETIYNMDDISRINLLDQYSNALFELGHYEKCLGHLETLILDVVNSDLDSKNNEIFCQLLLRKSCSQFNIDKLEDAEHVIKELIKIMPESIRSVKVLRTIHYKATTKSMGNFRAVLILFLFLGIGMTCMDLLIIQNFYPESAFITSITRNTIILFAGIGLIAAEFYAFYSSKWYASKFHRSSKDKKSIKSSQ